MFGLTDEQRAAVESTAKETVVIAGAGSGKTLVLASRVAYLLECGTSPVDLMVLTFTRKAADEMGKRIADIVGDEHAVRGASIGTLHRVFLDILRAEAEHLGYDGATLTVIDPDDQDVLLKRVIEDLGYKKQVSLAAARKVLEAWYNGSLILGDMGQDCLLDEKEKRLQRIALEFVARCRQHNIVTYGTILLEVRRLFREHPVVLAKWQARIKHIIVDEWQDTDPMQRRVIDQLAPPATLYVVGDPKQAIYGWRGADGTVALDGAEVFPLQTTFRCSVRITKAANRLMEHQGYTPMRTSKSASEGNVALTTGRSADIIGVIERLQGDGYEDEDIAVLARTNHTLRRLEKILQEHGKIPFHRVGQRFDFAKSKEFLDVVAALRFIVNPLDYLAAIRLGRKAHEHKQKHSEELSDRLRNLHDGFCCGHSIPLWEFLVDYKILFRTLAPDSLDEIVEWWKDNCPEGVTGPAALHWLNLRDNQEDVVPEGHVTLATIHTAKGGEWPAVIIWDAVQGTFPSARSIREGNLEEERNGMYVGMTRAETDLVIHYRRPQDQAKNRKINPPSQFIAEMGLEMEVWDTQTTLERNEGG